MGGVIYLMRKNGELIEMNERGYDTEDLLQGYLADHPDLLAGDQINEVEPRRWLLISREMGVPSEEGSGDRWSADHLFLDQDAIPTIVEVKRSTDTRARREVVAQMLDYAANGVMYWPLERLRSTFEANCAAQDHEPEATLIESLGLELDPEEFWQRTITNLQAGKVRLIFVADKIPTELRRIVEFLNEQMNPAEVLAIEIMQHVAEGQEERAFVPRLIGHTAQAERTKSVGVGPSRTIDEKSFFEALESNRGSDEAATAAKILERAKSNGFSIKWGSGSFTPTLGHAGSQHQVAGIYTDGTVEIKFSHMQWKPPFDVVSKRIELRNRLTEIEAIEIPEAHVTNKRPGFYLSKLRKREDLDHFLGVLDWFVREVKAT